MANGKKVTPLFGSLAISLSLYFGLTLIKENKALAIQSSTKPYVVVLDPGHGGTDIGASGKQGKKAVEEKDIALAIAFRAAKILSDPSYTKPLGRPVKVLLTRNADLYVSLEERAEIARSANADLFVSIHSNSENTHKANGLETYFLNNTNDEAALKLQQIENKGSKRAHTKAKVASLLIRSISADAVVESSRTAAEVLQSSMVDQLKKEDLNFQDRGVRQAMFYVLLDSQVPAVLVESFFLSNKKDLALVTEPENRGRIAEGLAKGVLRFLAQK